MVECNLVKLVRKQKTIIIYIEFHICRANTSSQMRNGCGLETEPRGGTIMRSNNRIICSIVCNPNCAVQYSTVQYSTVQYSTLRSPLWE